MLGMAASTKQKLIEVGFGLFNAEGFNAVGLDRIIAVVGVTKTTFYNHFESKDALMVAVLDDYCAREEVEYMAELEEFAPGQPAGQLAAMFPVLDRWMQQPDFRGCLFVTAAAEFPSPNHPVHRAAARQKTRWRAIYIDLATRAGAADPVALADRLALLTEGAVVLRHVGGDREAATKAAAVAELLFERYLPATARRGGSSTTQPA